MIEIPLTYIERRRIWCRAFERHEDSCGKNARPRLGIKDKDAMLANIHGCLGEYAVSKHYRIPWNGNLGNYNAADVGHLQVRAGFRDYMERFLIIQEKDNPDDTFIAVSLSGPLPKVFLAGWIFGHEAQYPEFFKKPGDPIGAQKIRKGGGGFFFPYERLQPMATLNVTPEFSLPE